MKIKEGYVLRNIAGESIIIPTGGAYADTRAIITLNDTAALIWKLLTEGKEIEAIVSAICDEYEVKYDSAMRDVSAFCAELIKRGLAGE